ncbi:MAG TPA: ComF family protein [Bacilli bacterium]|nr:ComF family protein [Bacilli bacterium]
MREEGVLQALIHLLYPVRRRCLLCHHPFVREEEVVCSPCTAQVRAGRPPFCRLCGREWTGEGVCADCGRRTATFFQRAVSFGPYERGLRRALLQLKNERRRELLPWLVERLVLAYAEHLLDRGVDLLVPVPMAAEKLQRRGFNQAEALAQGLSARVRVPVCLALDWRGSGRSQAAKTRAARLQGVEASLALSEAAGDVNGATVCLIDDVYTTGATANACAKKLIAAGAHTVYVLTLAR